MQPTQFGSYTLLERISHGGMAEVYRAKSVGEAGFEREVALKLLLPNMAEDQEFINMLIDEAKIAGQLNHANIAQIFDLGVAQNRYYIVQEYVRGRDLRAILKETAKNRTPLKVSTSCYVALKVCEGLHYAHNKAGTNGRPLSVVHRDISPHNVLLSDEGEVKIIDFGIAKANGRSTQTLAGLVKGKFAYMSPEQIRGLPVDHRSDVFATGILLHEMLSNRSLFRGESEFETLRRARAAVAGPPSKYNSEVPKELDAIVLKALARHVDDRYQNARALRDDLWAFAREHSAFQGAGQRHNHESGDVEVLVPSIASDISQITRSSTDRPVPGSVAPRGTPRPARPDLHGGRASEAHVRPTTPMKTVEPRGALASDFGGELEKATTVDPHYQLAQNQSALENYDGLDTDVGDKDLDLPEFGTDEDWAAGVRSSPFVLPVRNPAGKQSSGKEENTAPGPPGLRNSGIETTASGEIEAPEETTASGEITARGSMDVEETTAGGEDLSGDIDPADSVVIAETLAVATAPGSAHVADGRRTAPLRVQRPPPAGRSFPGGLDRTEEDAAPVPYQEAPGRPSFETSVDGDLGRASTARPERGMHPDDLGVVDLDLRDQAAETSPRSTDEAAATTPRNRDEAATTTPRPRRPSQAPAQIAPTHSDFPSTRRGGHEAPKAPREPQPTPYRGLEGSAPAPRPMAPYGVHVAPPQNSPIPKGSAWDKAVPQARATRLYLVGGALFILLVALAATVTLALTQ